MPAPTRTITRQGRYQLKIDPLSSHSRLLGSLPASGAGRRVLDIGGGEGFLARDLVERGYAVTAIAEPGSVAADFPAGATAIEVDLDRDVPDLGEPFDFVLCGDVLEHLRCPQEILAWIRGRLAPGGRLVASLPNGTHAYVRLQVLAGRFPKDDRGLFDRTHLHFFSWRGWVDLLDAAGFVVESCRPTPVPFGLVSSGPALQPVARGLERLNYAAARLWKTLLAYQFVVVARPTA
jgi:SAM-dependent methyltransferase